MKKTIDLVYIDKGEAVTNSMLLGEAFEKEHKHVIRDIEKQISKLIEAEEEDFIKSNFGLEYYRADNNKKSKKYSLTEDAYTLIGMAYTTPKAMKAKVKYIKEFNRVKQALADKNEEFNEVVEKARTKDVSLEEINKTRFSEKRTIRTFENSSIDDIKQLVTDFVNYAKGLDAETRKVRCKSAQNGIKRLHDRLATEGVTNIGDCYNLLIKIDEIKSLGHMAENKRNGGIKAYQTKVIKELHKKIG